MGKIARVLFIISISMILIIGCTSCESNLKYSVGKDTVDYYGDGTYQIGRTSDNVLSLNDLEKDCNLEENINKYELFDDILYVNGEVGYTIVNIKTGKIKQFVTSKSDDYRSDFMKEMFGKKYTRLNKYTDFTVAERNNFNDLVKKE